MSNQDRTRIIEWAITYNETWYGPRQSWTDEQWNRHHAVVGLLVMFATDFRFPEEE